MEWAYPGHGVLSRSNQKLFAAWAKEDPVDDWERDQVHGGDGPGCESGGNEPARREAG